RHHLYLYSGEPSSLRFPSPEHRCHGHADRGATSRVAVLRVLSRLALLLSRCLSSPISASLPSRQCRGRGKGCVPLSSPFQAELPGNDGAPSSSPHSSRFSIRKCLQSNLLTPLPVRRNY